jgi:Iron-binding zinc finger CDGSH type
MARLVRKEAKGPYELKNGTESIWICMCGLSDVQPFCNGTHKKTADEKHYPNSVCTFRYSLFPRQSKYGQLFVSEMKLTSRI